MSTFHFTQETPPESMLSDVQTLNKFNIDQFGQLLDVVFNFLKSPSKAHSHLFAPTPVDKSQSGRFLECLEEFAGDHGINISGLKAVTKTAINYPNYALKKNLSLTQVKEDLVNLGFSEEKADIFAEKYKENLLVLSKSALSNTLMVNQLVDMEWKFGVTAASSEMNKVGTTFLQLKLTIDKGNKNEDVHMELTLPQFYSFLHEMERAKASLDVLS